MKKRLYTLFSFLLMALFAANSFSQCLLPISNTNYNITLTGEKVLGQSFVADCNGTLTFITVRSNSPLVSIPDVQLKIWEDDPINGENVIFTQNGITLSGQDVLTQITVLNPPNIQLLGLYYFTLHHASIDLDLQAASAGTFATGYAVKNNLEPTDPSQLNDLYFEIEANVALPVELSKFEVNVNNRKVNLEWETLSESNNLGFEIERTYSGSHWQKVTFIKGSGQSKKIQKYTFLDKQARPGLNYYRLRQVDFNGNFEYSEVKAAHLEFVEDAQIYPNPSVDYVNIYVPEIYHKRFLSIHDVRGTLVKIIEQIEDQFTYQFDVSDFPEGIYVIRAGKIPLGRFLKSNIH